LAGYSVTYTVVDNATKQIDAINRRITQMRAPIDRMGRSLQQFVDVSGLRKVGDSFRWIASAAATAFRAISSVLGPMGVLTGAATLAGMVKLVSSFADWNRKLEENADRAGISARELQVFRDAITLAGGSADDMTETLKTLADTSAGAFRGSNTDALQWFQRAGIALTDANGKLKTSTQLLPEVVRYLDSLKNPSDRAAAAAALLGDAQAKVYESFKQSGKSLDDWVTQARQYKQLTEEQRATLDRFTLAQGKLQVAMEHLGQQASVTLAKGFTPFVEKLAEFVDKNTPAIIGALQYIIDHMDTITTVAEGIAIMFAVKWGVGIVGSILKVVTALGVGGTGTGLLGGLARVNALMLAINTALKAMDPATYAPENLPKNSPFWRGMDPKDKPPDDGEKSFDEKLREFFWEPLKRALGGSDVSGGAPGAPALPSPVAPQSAREPAPAVPGGAGAYLAGRAGQSPAAPGGPTAPAGPAAPLGAAAGKSAFYDEQRKLIYDAAVRAGVPHPEVVAEVGATQAQLESGGGKHTPGGFNVYGIKSGGGVGTAGAPVSTREEGAGGSYTTQASFAQFKNKEDAADAYVQFLQKNPRHYKPVLEAKTIEEGILAQGRSGYATDHKYLPALQNTQRQYGGAVAQGPATAPPAAPVATADPPRGSVDINITHRNPPPNSAVSVTGAGDVNVGRPRVEKVDLASI